MWLVRFFYYVGRRTLKHLKGHKGARRKFIYAAGKINQLPSWWQDNTPLE
jgi:hypothetical protein